MVGDRVADGRVDRPPRQATYVVAVLQEVADGQLGAPEVVGHDGDVVDGLGPLVQQDDPGVPGLDLGRRVVVSPG